jgi:hypothetical protein
MREYKKKYISKKTGEIKTYKYIKQVYANKKDYHKEAGTIKCTCGCVIGKYSKNRHIKTKKHLKLLEKLKL